MSIGFAGIVSLGMLGWRVDPTANWTVLLASDLGTRLAGAAAVATVRPDVPLVVTAPVASSRPMAQSRPQ
jgi:hypothetical protein